MASQDSQTFHWHYSEFDDRNFQIRGRTFFYAVVLFSIILLTSLLLLFARWLCRIRPTSAPYLAHPPPPSQPRGLDVATINSFPIVLHDSSTSTADFGESECCICLGLFEDGEKVKVLPKCRHCYHSVCVDKWLFSQSSCPICRSSLRVDSPV
ncbi:hypothetical protein Vadar_015015 [Vaccinium darrowii]|uniref:Uncharacterized protein n=1 Tax=Vaccinium darrowii TaxID=229202 RepID=A0ACB7YMA3_9ERIC|nr:hypothetical protein Vadar_015015 [Vaccinium darrowii]